MTTPLSLLAALVLTLAISTLVYHATGHSLIYGTLTLAIGIPLTIIVTSRWTDKSVAQGRGGPTATARTGSGAATQATLICGPSKSGKTALFLRLVKSHRQETGESDADSVPLTVTSITANEGQFVPVEADRKPLTVLDIPGNIKVREHAFSENIHRASKIILLVDSTALADRLANDVPFIVRVLAESLGRKRSCLLVLGKADLAGRTDPDVRHFVRLLDAAIMNWSKRLLSSHGSEGEHDDDLENLRCIQKHLGIDPEDPIELGPLDIQMVPYSLFDEEKSLGKIKEWIVCTTRSG